MGAFVVGIDQHDVATMSPHDIPGNAQAEAGAAALCRTGKRLEQSGNRQPCRPVQLPFPKRPDMQVQGMLLNQIINYKDMSEGRKNRKKELIRPFQQYFVPTDPENHLPMMRNWLAAINQLKDADWANAASCYSGFGTCRHYLEGRCDRV